MTDNSEQKFLLATVTSYSSTAGVQIRLDGETQAMTKKVKYLKTGESLSSGARVLVVKMSGTYVVLGQLYPIVLT